MHFERRKKGILRLLLAALFLCAGCGRKSEFVSPEGGFALAATGNPVQKKQSLPNPDGGVDITTLTFTLNDPPAEYWIVYIDYPEPTVRQKGGDRILNEARDGSVENVRGRLVAERKVFLGEYPGLEIDYEGASGDPNAYRSRIFLINHRLYVILVTAPAGKPFPAQARNFLDSFRLL